MAKNFKELDVIVHAGKSAVKTLATTAEFYAPSKNDDLPFREPNLSRLDMSLISKTSAETDVLVFNIPAREINEVKLKTEIAVRELMLSTPVEETAGRGEGFSSSPAFTVPLMLTAFKGKTAGEVLSADPSKKDELIAGRGYLEKNLERYPANKKQIDAINNAIELLEIGELTVGEPISKPSANVLTIYKREHKHKAKKDENGNNLIYSIAITCDPTKNMPFEISVMNCYAPLVTSSSGQTIVKMASAVNVKRLSMSLSDSEWIALVGQAYDLYENFKRINAPNAFKRAVENSYSPA